MITKSFTPVLLFTDNPSINSRTKEAREKTPIFQIIVSAAEEFLERKLTANEKTNVLQDKMPGVIKLLKNQLNMPRAETDIVLGIYGKSDSNLKAVFSNYFRINTYDIFNYEIKENEFILKQEAIVAINKLCEYWTQSEAGNKAHRLAKLLCETYNEAVDNGFLHPGFRTEFVNSTEWLTMYSKTPKGKEGVKPNYEKLSRIK